MLSPPENRFPAENRESGGEAPRSKRTSRHAKIRLTV